MRNWMAQSTTEQRDTFQMQTSKMASPARQGEAREKPQWPHPQIHSQIYMCMCTHAHTYTLMHTYSHTRFHMHLHIHVCVLTLTHTHIQRPNWWILQQHPHFLQSPQNSSLAALAQTGPRKGGDSPSSPPVFMPPAQEGKYAGSRSPPVPSQLPDSPPTVWEHSQAPRGSLVTQLLTPQCTAAHPKLPTPSLVGLSVPVRNPLGLAMLMPDTEQKQDLPKCKQLQQRKRDKNPQPKANPLPQSLFGGKGSSACGFFPLWMQ